MMLRKRSRSVGGKQGLMSDPHSLPISYSSSSYFIGNHSYKPRFSFSVFTSPSLSSNNFSSIHENKNFSPIGNLLSFARHLEKSPFEPSGENGGGSRAVGLGIVDALNDEESGERSKVLFGSSKLKIQVPSVINNRNAASLVASLEVPTSPIEFGIKNRDSQLALLSPSAQSSSSSQVVIGSISASEMELSEDYTCVIIHGPNPKTTHIFDNCILESNGDGFVVARKENSSLLVESESYPLNDFMSYCDACKKNLGQGKDTLNI